MQLDAVDGLKKIWADGPLRKTLGLVIVAWAVTIGLLVYQDAGLSEGPIIVIAFLFHALFVLFVVNLGTEITRLSTKKLAAVYLLSLPFIYVITVGVIALGVVMMFVDILLSAIFSHLLCMSVGRWVQARVEKRERGLLGSLVLMGIFGIVAILMFGLVTAVMSSGVLGEFSLVLPFLRIFVPAVFVIGLLVGIARKRVPVALSVYFFVVFFYLLYLLLRAGVTAAGFGAGSTSLILLPYNVFILLYSIGLVTHHAIGDRKFTESHRLRAVVIFFMFVKIFMNIATIDTSTPEGQAQNLQLDLTAIMAFTAFVVIYAFYVIWKFTGPRPGGKPPVIPPASKASTKSRGVATGDGTEPQEAGGLSDDDLW